jgi:hypothetical protein
MLSELTEAMIVNGVVLATVLVRTVGLAVRASRLPGGELAREEAREAQGA